MKYRPLLIALVSTGALLGGCKDKSAGGADAAKAAPTGTAATVGGEDVSRSVYEFYVKNSTGKASSELTPEQRGELLDQLIGLEVAAQAAEKAGMDKETDVASRLYLTRLNVLADVAVRKKLGDQQRPSDQELRAEYETQVAALPQVEYKARHILVATEPFAQSLIEKIQKGADFAAIARKESMDNKEKAGELDWMSPGANTEFGKALAGLKKGEITAKPVKTQYGYHVIQLEDTRPVSPPEFDTVRERLAGIVQQKKVQAYVDELKKASKIEKKI